MNPIKPITAMALAAVAAAPVTASNPMEETVVVSSLVEMPVRQLGTSVSIVTEQDLQIRGFATLANSLRYEPGISVTNNGGAGQPTAMRIRGESDFRTKVFLDGMELTDTSGVQAGPQIQTIMSNGLSRVEILRGPQGMVYGADAGGVVRISTLPPEQGLNGTVSAEYGRYGTTNFFGSLSGGNELGDIGIIASNFETDGFNSRDLDTVLRDDDGYENDTYYLRGGLNITDGLRAELQARSVEGDNDFDTCSIPPNFDPTDACTSETDEDSWRAVMRYESTDHVGELAYSNYETDRTFKSAGVTSFVAEGELDRVNYVGNLRVTESQSFVYGGEWRNEAIDDGNVDTDRDQTGYFAEYQAGFNNSLFLTAGFRYDDNDDFGSETTYRVSGAYLIPAGDGEVKLKTAYGTGFRAPSLFEISYNNSPSAFPPALGLELGAETSEGFDIGAGYYANSGWFIETVYFDQTIEDEIFFDLVDFSGYLQGDGDSESQGVEVIGELPLGDMFRITGNYTYTDADNADGDTRPRVRKHIGNLGLHMLALNDKLQVSLNFRVANDAPDEQGLEVDDYEVLDISATYAITDDLEVFGRVENTTDEDYQEIPTYNTSGAAGYVGVRYAFSAN